MAVANYHELYGCYPPPFVIGPDGRPWHSWRVLILEFIEEHELYREYDFSEPWDGPNNRKLADRIPLMYQFPDSERSGNPTTGYLVVVGGETAWPASGSVSVDDVADGTGATISIVENLGAGVHWMEPRDLTFDGIDLRLNRPGGISSPYTRPAVVTLDGTVRMLDLDITARMLRGLLTIRGGEPIQPDGLRGWVEIPDGRQRPLRQP